MFFTFEGLNSLAAGLGFKLYKFWNLQFCREARCQAVPWNKINTSHVAILLFCIFGSFENICCSINQDLVVSVDVDVNVNVVIIPVIIVLSFINFYKSAWKSWNMDFYVAKPVAVLRATWDFIPRYYGFIYEIIHFGLLVWWYLVKTSFCYVATFQYNPSWQTTALV